MPSAEDLKKAIGRSYEWWIKLRDYIYMKYPKAIEEWKYPGVKYGWSFRVKDKKRVIIYLLPRENTFKVAIIFGQKATDAVMASDISDHIKKELKNAIPYVEGRGIRIEINNNEIMEDLKKLIDIKLAC